MKLHVPAPRMYQIIREQRDITPDTALRLARFFRTTAEFWLNLQAHYELEVARIKSRPRLNERSGLLRLRLLSLLTAPRTGFVKQLKIDPENLT